MTFHSAKIQNKINMQRKLVGLFVFFVLFFSNVQTQGQDQISQTKGKNSISEADLKNYYRKIHSRIPSDRGIDKNKVLSVKNKDANNVKAPLNVPDDMIFPIESDEVQAILMTWFYNTFTTNNDEPAEQMFDGLGVSYFSSNYTLEPVYSLPDVSANSKFARIFAQLADNIQKHTQVWINIWNAEDSVAIKDFMNELGTPLTNYRFFVNPGNSFWYRDCGPVAFYYGDDDNIGFLDFEYYGGRPLDDKIAKNIGEQAGYDVFTTTIEYEGGNVLLDGVGTLFTSDAVFDANEDNYGLYYLDEHSDYYGYAIQYKNSLTESQVRDSLTHLLNLNRCVILPSLRYDGGTGHIDLYADMWDENTFVSTKHPDVMANLSDPQTVEENMDSICNMETMFGQNYHNTRIPLPAKNDGSWYTSQSQYNSQYTRSFSNHTFVNDAIIQPVFYDESLSGSAAGDTDGNKEALEIIKQKYPGYTIEEMDVREFDGFGGAIHCITKQIPAENPLRIYHDPIRWWNTQENNSPNYRAIIQNKSGIASATLFYKKVNETSWHQTDLTAEEGNMFSAMLTLDETPRDTLQYYISATSNNGKTITKPMTAPQGFYTTVYGSHVNGISEDNVYVSVERIKVGELDGIGEFYPNPARDFTQIDFSNSFSSDLNVRLVNSKGQVLMNEIICKGERILQIDTRRLSPGIYWAIFSCDNISTARKLVISK